MEQLPKKWCVERTPETCKEINRYFSLLYGKQYKGRGRSDMHKSDYMHFPKVITKRYRCGRTATSHPYHEVISFETFKNLVLKMKKETTEVKKLIGYKLKFPEYKKAALAICNTVGNWENSLQNHDISINQNGYISRLTNAEVLDKWFEEVYETAPELPVIQGSDGCNYHGYINKEYVVYGCAYLPIVWFTSSPNRTINAMNVGNNVFITSDEVTAIRTYLKYHGHVK